MKIAIGCDEAAYRLIAEIMKHLDEKGVEYQDLGADERETVLYPDIAVKAAEAVAREEFERGILVCGTGIGMAITANKVPGIRAAVCHDLFSAERARKSNDAQIMCMRELDFNLLNRMKKMVGGLVIIPLVIAVLIATFVPQAFQIGGYVTALFYNRKVRP